MRTTIIIVGAIAALASQGAQAQSAVYYARQTLNGIVKTPTATPTPPAVKRTCGPLALFKDFTGTKINITTRTDASIDPVALCSAIPNVTACYRNSYTGIWYTTDTDPTKIRLNSAGVDHAASVCT